MFLHSFSVYLVYINPESWGNVIFTLLELILPAAENLWNLQCFEAGSVLCAQRSPSDIHRLRWAKVSRTGLGMMHSGMMHIFSLSLVENKFWSSYHFYGCLSTSNSMFPKSKERGEGRLNVSEWCIWLNWSISPSLLNKNNFFFI